MGDTDIVRVSCATENCGTFPMDKALNKRLRRSGNTFTCPAGHKQSYNTTDPKKELREEISRLKQKLSRTEGRLENYRDNLSDMWDDLREERELREAIEKSILEDVDGAVEILEGRWKWACECGNKTTATYDTEREAWGKYDAHRERLHDDAGAIEA